MYVPNHFKEDDQEKLLQYISDYGFGMLVVVDEQMVEANHVPFYLSSGDGALGQPPMHRHNTSLQRIAFGDK